MIYAQTMLCGILIAYSYSNTDTEYNTEPYNFLTSILRYRLKDNFLYHFYIPIASTEYSISLWKNNAINPELLYQGFMTTGIIK